MNATLQNTWEKYTSAWKMTDRAGRLAVFAEALTEGAVYTDPLVQAGSWDELITYMENFHQQVPGGHFVTTSFSSHHQKSIASWDMKTPDGATIGTGTSYGEYDAAGKLLSMNGFFQVPG
ncbi:nuclear transport factor 2 family protein [Massilia sp. P8910]|uniref:nuclear transport factor 2 family protein n=1 Tax=Massilia antarctica TaxID=2765360 RepID=UPI0006BB5465|nr:MULTISPECIES: nuclear transport factor 2 family protein [Massilia]MCE3603267.1 nuclear transport factor 2 family protein [Massilia antarctica]MCY0913470.1 nuclear transport factor 2 family protein [Massilia sp. H27-R4]CUI09607.1 probable isomerase [Janthinobacterium sp. CG23_2]CUU33393.1 probable isomerase [Janthinobacterium sp. CG23_2]